jgi:hypothetical protein
VVISWNRPTCCVASLWPDEAVLPPLLAELEPGKALDG